MEINRPHYLEDLLMKNTNGIDSEIIKRVKEKLPKSFIVNSDDTFLTVECINSYRNDDVTIAYTIDIPVKSIEYSTLKRCIDDDYKIIYFSWDKIIDNLDIL